MTCACWCEQRLAAGDSDAQILDFVTARYGMFVLLDPPFAPVTWLLWLVPPVLVLGGGALLLGPGAPAC